MQCELVGWLAGGWQLMFVNGQSMFAFKTAQNDHLYDYNQCLYIGLGLGLSRV